MVVEVRSPIISFWVGITDSFRLITYSDGRDPSHTVTSGRLGPDKTFVESGSEYGRTGLT